MSKTTMTSISSGFATSDGLRKQHTCRNCGATGHVYKDCKQPTMSFGLICYRWTRGVPEYLMIQRKDSLSFMEFVRGKYDLSTIDDAKYILDLFGMMTENERKLIQGGNFDNLWNHIWCQTSIPKQTHEFIECRKKFDALKAGFPVRNRDGFVEYNFNLDYALSHTKSKYNEPEWGFPKGRRRLRETDLDCAIREFCEETGCIQTDFEVIITNPYRETFLGTNKTPYSHVYYLTHMRETPAREPYVDPHNIQQIREVRNVGWFSYDQVIERIREHNWERRNIFQLAHKKVYEFHTKKLHVEPTRTIHDNSTRGGEFTIGPLSTGALYESGIGWGYNQIPYQLPINACYIGPYPGLAQPPFIYPFAFPDIANTTSPQIASTFSTISVLP